MKLLEKLQESHVHIKDESSVYAKLEALFKGGASSLQIISDFDMTLSRYSVNNQRCPSSHGILEAGMCLSAEAKEHLHETNKKYRAIEIDPHMSPDEKIPFMLEWWGKAHSAMGNVVISKSMIKNAVATSTAMLKDGCSELFNTLHKHSVPLLVFSAGLGDVIEEVIRQKSHFHPNMKTVSNFMKFNEKDIMVGFDGLLIHSFNKNEGALVHSEYFEEISHRHNIILLGDMMGDLHMADGVQNINSILKIGYLNQNV
ncbi:unnamed protein product [Clavelina lepadiformis]|uniref:5'-nucleotidase n=1 Tax=Clavelina lepadiformis TaxID=159417 RepID=A0ABP0H5X6_CLALP